MAAITSILAANTGPIPRVRLAKTGFQGAGDCDGAGLGAEAFTSRHVEELIVHSTHSVQFFPAPPLRSLHQFSGKRVAILGLGRIGLAVAKRAEAFGCSISYHSRSEKPFPKYKFCTNVVDLAANCDVLIVACSLNAETHHIVSRKVIDALGPEGVLINIGRGTHVDEPELVSALLERRLGAAGLDVFEHEPFAPEQLFNLDNVVLVPHIGSDTDETCRAMADLVLGNLEAHALNKPLLTPVI